jgi:hypothetical protein
MPARQYVIEEMRHEDDSGFSRAPSDECGLTMDSEGLRRVVEAG